MQISRWFTKAKKRTGFWEILDSCYSIKFICGCYDKRSNKENECCLSNLLSGMYCTTTICQCPVISPPSHKCNRSICCLRSFCSTAGLPFHVHLFLWHVGGSRLFSKVAHTEQRSSVNNAKWVFPPLLLSLQWADETTKEPNHCHSKLAPDFLQDLSSLMLPVAHIPPPAF